MRFSRVDLSSLTRAEWIAIKIFFAYAIFRVCYDLTHPEIWSDPLYDPRIYLPVTAVFLPVFVLWAMWMQGRIEERKERIRNIRSR